MKKATFVRDLTPGTAIKDVFLVQAFDKRVAKNGKHYATVALRDRTGDVPGKIWTDRAGEEILDVPKGSFLKVDAIPSLYKDELQLTLNRYRLVNDDEVEIEDFVPASKRNRDELWEELQDHIASVKHPDIQGFLFHITGQNKTSLRDCPAAKSKHQPYLGGLLEHILSLIRTVDAAAANYCGKLDRDLLVAACVLHDIGKLEELIWSREIGYSVRGKLIGHILQGFDMIRWHAFECSTIKGTILEAPWFIHLEHIVASHHGRREWGAARVPLSREAWIFHLSDMMDARMGLFDSIEDQPRDADGFTTKFIPELEGQAYFPVTENRGRLTESQPHEDSGVERCPAEVSEPTDVVGGDQAGDSGEVFAEDSEGLRQS